MAEWIRFHLDENVPKGIVLGLRRYEIDVTTTNEVGLNRRSDEEQLQFIKTTQRVIFTQDSDFLILASRSRDHPGITYCQKGKKSTGDIIAALVLIYEVLTLKEMRGKIEFL